MELIKRHLEETKSLGEMQRTQNAFSLEYCISKGIKPLKEATVNVLS